MSGFEVKREDTTCPAGRDGAECGPVFFPLGLCETTIAGPSVGGVPLAASTFRRFGGRSASLSSVRSVVLGVWGSLRFLDVL